MLHQLKIVEIPTIKMPIQPSPGFGKKRLSDFKLDLLGLCEYGCSYCSSNHGFYQRIHKENFADLAEQQLGERLYPDDDPLLTHHWPDVIENLDLQLAQHDTTWGEGKTLVLSMLTDGFSPTLVKDGITKEALSMVLNRTSFRIRILTKNAVVGSRKWIEFFEEHSGRFVVGLSTGTFSNDWAKRIEVNTPPPSARIKALRNLQDAGIPTYAMLCPVFPHMLEGQMLEQLIDSIRPGLVDDVWAEPYNDRQNWRGLHQHLEPTDYDHAWIGEVYGSKNFAKWSRYATDLYLRLKSKAEAGGWLSKLRYLLYELDITESDAPSFSGLDGVLPQSKPDDDGMSQNPFIAKLQRKAR